MPYIGIGNVKEYNLSVIFILKLTFVFGFTVYKWSQSLARVGTLLADAFTHRLSAVG